MNIQQLRQEARYLVAKVDRVLAGENVEQETLNETWSELEVLYVHARRFLGAGFSLVGAKKEWTVIRKYAQSVDRECDRLGPKDEDEQALAGT
jgi:hypothetical protein